MMEAVLRNRIEDVFRTERKSLLRFVKSRVNDPEDAEDILSDVFLQAMLNAHSLEYVDNLLAWLRTSLRNKIIDGYRKKQLPKVSLDTSPGNGEGESTLVDIIRDSGIDIEKDFIRSLVLEELMESIDDLPEEQRSVVLAQAVEGRSFRELSEASGTSINTLLARKRYALSTLKKKLAEIKEMIDEII
jgi:RNA polymerase sigma factor (sigma-70 family)